jgi:hypothetical protein
MRIDYVRWFNKWHVRMQGHVIGNVNVYDVLRIDQVQKKLLLSVRRHRRLHVNADVWLLKQDVLGNGMRVDHLNHEHLVHLVHRDHEERMFRFGCPMYVKMKKKWMVE